MAYTSIVTLLSHVTEGWREYKYRNVRHVIRNKNKNNDNRSEGGGTISGMPASPLESKHLGGNL